MRIVSLLSVVLSLSVVSAQEVEEGESAAATTEDPGRLRGLPPAEADAGEYPAHSGRGEAQLERMLPPQTLAEIDAMPSEYGMIKYHFSLGFGPFAMVGDCGRGSPLAKYMRELGFTHPDEHVGCDSRQPSGASGTGRICIWRNSERPPR